MLIAVAPKLEHYPEEITQGYEGRDLTLSCSGTGRPEPEYKWYKVSRKSDYSDQEQETNEKILISHITQKFVNVQK